MKFARQTCPFAPTNPAAASRASRLAAAALVIVLAFQLFSFSAFATQVWFAFTNTSTGLLDTNDFKIIPQQSTINGNPIRNSDGSWQVAGLPVRYHNPTGIATNWLTTGCYQVTNQFIGANFFFRIPDASSNVLASGDPSIYIGGANAFVTLNIGSGGGTVLWTAAGTTIYPSGATGTSGGWVGTGSQIYPQ